jgi:hypothetical protein
MTGRGNRTIRGIVQSEEGVPLAGALVMGLDLSYAETAEDGTFTICNPEMALMFWCGGYYPATHVLNGLEQLRITLRAVPAKAARLARH